MSTPSRTRLTLIRRIILWSGALIVALAFISICVTVYFPALSRLDWPFVRTVAQISGVLLYFWCWFKTAHTPLYWVAELCIWLESHQQQARVIGAEALEEYRLRRPAMQMRIRQKIGSGGGIQSGGVQEIA